MGFFSKPKVTVSCLVRFQIMYLKTDLTDLTDLTDITDLVYNPRKRIYTVTVGHVHDVM